MTDKVVRGFVVVFVIFLAIVMVAGIIQEMCWKMTSSRQMAQLSKHFFKVKLSTSMLFVFTGLGWIALDEFCSSGPITTSPFIKQRP